MFFTGFCPKCGDGLLGVKLCSGPEPHPVVLCDECDALWTSPDFAQPVIYPEQPDLPCPICSAPLQSAEAKWATHTEIESIGWADEIRGEYQPAGPRPAPCGNEGPIADPESEA